MTGDGGVASPLSTELVAIILDAVVVELSAWLAGDASASEAALLTTEFCAALWPSQNSLVSAIPHERRSMDLPDLVADSAKSLQIPGSTS